MSFEFYRLRFRFRAADSLHFPAGKPGNVVRGAFGTIFRRVACACAGDHHRDCAYARVFEPKATPGEGPSGLADRPRPFVFRAAHLDGRTLRPGESFHFDVHLFDTRRDTLASGFVRAFAELAHEGLGPRRGRADLESVDQLGLDDTVAGRIFEAATSRMTAQPPPAAVDLDQAEPVRQLRVRFVTPTELKSGEQVAERPEFPVLFGRARDRVSTLRALYGAGPLDIDFRETGRRAAEIRMTRCELAWCDAGRRSSRTRQVHPLGGFVGVAEYQGDLGEFLPHLRAAQWTGIGRQTVWGKGVIALEAAD